MSERDHRSALLTPLSHATFCRIWVASLFSNFGYLIHTVGAAWAMTELAGEANMVALVQTAAVLPVMVFALAAGAVADTYDRRKVGLAALAISIVGATGLTLSSWMGYLNPTLILVFTLVIGSGMALFGPAWQASVPEMLPMTNLPAAISLNSISFNIARSFGPAIGGIIVASAGAAAAFLVNGLFYLPMIGALLMWRRREDIARFPPERLQRAIVSGVRYAFHSPSIRVVLTRSLFIGAPGCVLAALMPLIARDLLHGGAQIYGLALGAFGIGAVLGAMTVGTLTARAGLEGSVRLSTAAMATAAAVIAISSSLWVTGAMLMLAGIGWMVSITSLNVVIQTMAPRWVAGRALAAYHTAIAGGIAAGSWFWGHLADHIAVSGALLVAGATIAATLAAGRWLRLPDAVVPVSEAQRELSDPEVELAITDRSGPIIVDLQFRVARENARAFHGAMQEVQRIRRRNGAYDWSLARDLADAEVWNERYYCPTWLDYLRQRSRHTEAESETLRRAYAFHMGEDGPRVRRMLERPLGSVRWHEEVHDDPITPILPAAPGPGG